LKRIQIQEWVIYRGEEERKEERKEEGKETRSAKD
jgi:hypothetical protein